MKRKFLHDVSINTLQVVIVQSCGLIIFYLLSTRLDKNEFGQINWVLALLLTAFGILSLGIDQVAVRRIASGAGVKHLLSIYMSHVLLAGCIFYIMLWIISGVFSPFSGYQQVLLLLGIGKLMLFFSTPFRQIATGLEKFRLLFFMAVTSNVLRAVILVLCGFLNQLNLQVIVIVFVVTDLAEFLVCLFIMQEVLKVPLQFKWNIHAYKALVKEALPQFGVAVFASALSRLDWIFLGILAGNIILAEYSFAYKVFEMATLPMLVIAPVLIPRFTKLFHKDTVEIPAEKITGLLVLLRLEIVIASLVALVLNIVWVPLVDLLTDHKYGSVNRLTMLLLSASMPFLYLNNFLWTINFAKGRLKMIFYIFLISFLFNLVFDIALIPFFNAEGAAIAYFIAIIAQSVAYIKRTELAGLQKSSYCLLFCPLAALVSGILTTTFFNTIWINILLAPGLCILLLCLTKQVRLTDWLTFRKLAHL